MAIEGQRCRYHGGATPKAKAARRRREVEAKVKAELGRLKYEAVEDPLTALQMLAGEVGAWKRMLSDHVARLTEMRYAGLTGEQIRAEVVLFERAMDRCASVLVAIARLNIDERLVRVDEQRAMLVARALSAALAGMGMGQDVQREAMRRVGEQLRLTA